MSGTIDLSPFECWKLVERQGTVARVVWSGLEGPAIVPLNYVVADGALWFQTSPRSRLATECANRSVLVEVDHGDPETRQGWSVIVSGTLRLVEPDDVPEVLGDLDIWPPGPHPAYVRVEPDSMTGRRIRGLGS